MRGVVTARAIWKGIAKLSGASLPVKLYSAVQEKTVHFHILDRHTLTRVKQRLVDPKTGDEAPLAGVRKAYEVEPGTFVLLDQKELRQLEPEPSRDIEIIRFFKQGVIGREWYERPYFLGPDGDPDGYFALAAAMERLQCEGLARWVMRKSSYVGAVRPEQGYLMLITLRHAGEVLSARELAAPPGRAVESKEQVIARQLVSALEDEFRPEDYRDEYRERLMKHIEAKAQGEKPRLKLVHSKPKKGSLSEMLEASLKAVKPKKGAAAA